MSSLEMQSHLVALPIVVDLLGEGDKIVSESNRPLTPEEQELKRLYTERFGVWTDGHELFLRLSGGYFKPYLDVLSVPYHNNALTPRERALIMFAVNVSVTHLNEKGIRASALAALAMGCSGEDLVHVIRRTSSLGMHSCMVAFPILLEKLTTANVAPPCS